MQGLEVEVQRLINRHKAELESAHERAAEQVKVALEGAKVEQEAQLQALRDKLRKVSSSKLARSGDDVLHAESKSTYCQDS
jgi:vacuolar-type H+-ATPase subunit H